MPNFDIILVNGKETQAFLNEVNEAVVTERPSLFRSLGEVLVADVKRRIMTSDDGKWAPASKWLRAKTGQSKVLLGAEKFVRYQFTRDMLHVLGKSGKWTLTQHHEGFENKLVDPSEPRDPYGRVILKIKDGNPLKLYVEMRRKRDGTVTQRTQTFSFIAKKIGRTPARKIWANEQEVIKMATPVSSRWFETLIRKAGGSLVHT
jgi:hypothetical protein